MSTRGKQAEDIQEVSSCEKDGCCSTTDDGSPMCVIPVNQAPAEASCCCASTAEASCGCNPSTTSVIEVRQISGEPVKKKGWIDIDDCKQMWHKIRGGVMFAVGCITSPCCTPLIVPIFLALIAGTPLAAWLGQNLGWVYGGLTLVSVVSLVVGWRWLNKPSKSKRILRGSGTPALSSFVGDKVHAD